MDFLTQDTLLVAFQLLYHSMEFKQVKIHPRLLSLTGSELDGLLWNKLDDTSFLNTDLQTPDSLLEGEVEMSPWLWNKEKQGRERAPWEAQT